MTPEAARRHVGGVSGSVAVASRTDRTPCVDHYGRMIHHATVHVDGYKVKNPNRPLAEWVRANNRFCEDWFERASGDTTIAVPAKLADAAAYLGTRPVCFVFTSDQTLGDRPWVWISQERASLLAEMKDDFSLRTLVRRYWTRPGDAPGILAHASVCPDYAKVIQALQMSLGRRADWPCDSAAIVRSWVDDPAWGIVAVPDGAAADRLARQPIQVRREEPAPLLPPATGQDAVASGPVPVVVLVTPQPEPASPPVLTCDDPEWAVGVPHRGRAPDGGVVDLLPPVPAPPPAPQPCSGCGAVDGEGKPTACQQDCPVSYVQRTPSTAPPETTP